MDAHSIQTFIDEINRYGGTRYKKFIPENAPLVDEMFEAAKEIVPCDAYRDGSDRTFWLWALDDESGETKWFKLYLAEHDGNRGIWFANRKIYDNRKIDHIGTYNQSELIDAEPLLKWIISAEKKCIDMIHEGHYSEFINANLPFKHRSGIIKLNKYWEFVPDDKEDLSYGINTDELERFKAWTPEETVGLDAMTPNYYYSACDFIYDLIGVKEEYPLSEKADTPKKIYKTYAACYSETDQLLELIDDSAEEFDRYLSSGYISHHVWEMCLVPNIHLYPQKINNQYFLRIAFEELKDYGLNIHLELIMKEHGFPIIKNTSIEETLSGDYFISILPYGDNYDSRYAFDHKIYTNDHRWLPDEECDALIKEIDWFPITTDWRTYTHKKQTQE